MHVDRWSSYVVDCDSLSPGSLQHLTYLDLFATFQISGYWFPVPLMLKTYNEIAGWLFLKRTHHPGHVDIPSECLRLE